MADLGGHAVLPGAVCGSYSAYSEPSTRASHTEVGGDHTCEIDRDLEAGGGAAVGKKRLLSQEWSATVPAADHAENLEWESEYTHLAVSESMVRKSAEIIECFSLKEEDKHLLRAAPLSKVLAQNAYVLASGMVAGWQSDWDWEAVSAPVTELDAFLSHNWSAPRTTKFLQLGLHFHWWPAVVSLLPAVLAGAALNLTRLLPVLDFEASHTLPPMCIGCTAVGMPTFILVLLWWSQILGCLGLHRWSAKVFLDKYCVHQHDADKKRRGIALLPVWILQSREMFVLANKDYFTRIWTVYEMASFLCVKSKQRMHIMPSFLPKLVLVACLTYTLIASAFYVMTCKAVIDATVDTPLARATAMWPYVLGVVALLGIPFLYLILFHWAAEERATQEKLRTFRIQDSQCAVEEDRIAVYHTVAAFEVACGFVQESATEEQALDSFNRRVQQTLPEVLAENSGRIGVPYRYVVAVFLCTTLRGLDVVCAFILQPYPWRNFAIEVAKPIAQHFGVLPALSVLLVFTARKAVTFQTQLWKQRVLSIVGVVTVIVISLLQRLALTSLAKKSVESDIALAMFVMLNALFAVFSFCTYRRNHAAADAEDTQATERRRDLVSNIFKRNQTIMWLDSEEA